MGFLGAIFVFFSSVCSSVGSALCSIGSQIASTIAKAAPVLVEIAKPVLEIAKVVVEVVIEAVVKIVDGVAKALGVVEKDIEPDELGARAMAHPEIKPESYDSYSDYIKELGKADFDREEFDKLSPAQKAAATAVGCGIEAKAIAEKMEMNIPMDFFVASVKGKMSANDVCGLLNAMKSNGITDAGVFSQYTQGTLSPEAEKKLEPAFAEYESNGGKSIDSIQNDIDNKTLEKEVQTEG